MHNLLSFVLFLFFTLWVSASQAQDDLDALLDAASTPAREYITGTFKGTRVINLQSVEKSAPGALQFLIQHRFGPVNGGGYQLFGLDQATIRIGLEYGISRFLAVGIGRSSFEKTYDAFVKTTLIRQSKGKGAFPFSVLYFGSMALNTLKFTDTVKQYFSSRMAFTHQLIMGAKISDRFSLQVSPTVVHKNLVKAVNDPNDFYSVGVASRIKVTKRTSLNFEYIYRIPPEDKAAPAYVQYKNALAIGCDIETGGHVFQFHLTNALPMIEKGFITETTETWSNGGIHLGFNISRDFTLRKNKTHKKW